MRGHKQLIPYVFASLIGSAVLLASTGFAMRTTNDTEEEITPVLTEAVLKENAHLFDLAIPYVCWSRGGVNFGDINKPLSEVLLEGKSPFCGPHEVILGKTDISISDALAKGITCGGHTYKIVRLDYFSKMYDEEEKSVGGQNDRTLGDFLTYHEALPLNPLPYTLQTTNLLPGQFHFKYGAERSGGPITTRISFFMSLDKSS